MIAFLFSAPGAAVLAAAGLLSPVDGLVALTLGFLVVLAVSRFVRSQPASEPAHKAADIAHRVLQALDRQLPEPATTAVLVRSPANCEWFTLSARTSGYIASIDWAALELLCHERNLWMQLEREIGEFVTPQTSLLAISEPPDPALRFACLRALVIKPVRSEQQDIGYGICQLAVMAAQAMAPESEDLLTTRTCIDYLAAIFSVLARRSLRPPLRRVLGRPLRFEALMSDAFVPMRRAAEGNAEVLRLMLRALETIGRSAHLPGRRRAIIEQAGLLSEAAERTVESPFDQEALELYATQVIWELSKQDIARSVGLMRFQDEG